MIIPRPVLGSFGCGALLGLGPLQVTLSGRFTPPTCRGDGDRFCMFDAPVSQQTFDLGSCRDPGNLAQCNKSMSGSQVELVEGALQATARPQLPSQANLLAVELKQPPPYPLTAPVLRWV